MLRSRHWLVVLLLWIVVSPALAQTPASDTPRPNIVMILADDLGWADLGCYGSSYYKTPNLDRMAKEGMRFTDAYASCPVCSPTRAAILTGKVPARLGLTDWLPGRPDSPAHALLRPTLPQQLALEETTIAELLGGAGYRTAHIGKWHLGGKGFEPTRQGFHVNIAGDHTGTARSYFAPYRDKDGFMPGLEKAPEGEYLTDRLTSEAVRFIEDNRSRPFFLYLPHYSVHTPLKARAETIKKYPGKLVLGRQSSPVYAAMLDSLDEGVGRILQTLERLNLAKDTIVVFTSDNGGLATREGEGTPSTINSPLRDGKGWLYEGGIRVPLLVRWPGVVPANVVSAEPVISHDWFPTLLEAAQTRAGDGVRDGVSLLPLLRGKSKLNREALYWHYPHYANQGSRPSGAIRQGRYKMIEFYQDQRRELFDLGESIGEHVNLAEKKPEVVRELAEKLDRWRKEVGARMPTPNPDYKPNPQDRKGVVTMHARTAQVHGTQLRYEPLTHKETLGYWMDVRDHASWEFTLTRPGKYTVEVLQGCGTGNGGSKVNVEIGEQKLPFTVEDTGGFQAFKARTIGVVQLDKTGRNTLVVRPQTKANVAVMDIRQVRLLPAE